jgi:sugar O-acyltransferase (sialic acid O-acetyltransferase NeuD family)
MEMTWAMAELDLQSLSRDKLKKKLLIFGAGETATIAAEFFKYDSSEEIAGFIVDDAYWEIDKNFYGLPLYPLSVILDSYSPNQYKIFVAVSYGQLNRERLRIFNIFKNEGYEFASYVSTRATVWRTASIGKNCMIFEGNNIQHNAVIEDNVILWSGNHIGHGSKIHHSAYLSSHVCVAGFADIGERSFIGINTSIIDYAKVAEDCFVGANTLINKNTDPNSIYTGNPGVKNMKVSASKYFKVKP